MSHPANMLQEMMPELDKIRSRADAAFNEVARQFPQAISCKPTCDDCCHALFDLTPIESLAIALGYMELGRNQRRDIQRRAKKAARMFDAVLKEAFAKSGEERLAVLSKARIPCPLLEKKRCVLYEQRPVTCRLYGVPVAVEGSARTCHLARFEPGQTYPTVDMVKLQNELERISGVVMRRLPSLPYARRDVARSIEMASSHGPLLRSFVG